MTKRRSSRVSSRTRPKRRPSNSRTRGQSSQFSTKSLIRGGGLVLAAVAALTLLSLFSLSRGVVTETWIRWLSLAFGWGIYLVTVAIGVLGVWLFLRSFDSAPPSALERWIGLSALLFATLGWLHAFASDPVASAAAGHGGGYVGLFIRQALVGGLGQLGMFVALVALSILGLILAFDVSLPKVWHKTAEIAGLVAQAIRTWRSERAAKQQSLPEPRPAPIVINGGAQREASKAPAAGPKSAMTGAHHVREAKLLQPRILGEQERLHWQLPTLSSVLDEVTEQDISQSEIRHRARLIEETLAGFGVPGYVTEVNQGPTVTQFGVEPGYVERRDKNGEVKRSKVKVNGIAALVKDLELALAAAPIRIEAPVPGRSVVGIEVPNAQVSVVSLRGVMESDEFAQQKGDLPIALGRDVSGQPIVADLASMPHLLVAGATGSGKSACINAIIACLLCTHTPDQLRLILVDPKMVEMVNYNGIPHLLSPVVTDVTRVVDTLKWAVREMDRRYRVFSAAGARNLAAYNAQLQTRGEPALPLITILIDELADLMMVAPDEVERHICRIAQLARATGIHLVIATQRPSVDVVTGLIKANFPARISFAVTSQVDSRVILDSPGAEALLGSGDMLFMAPDSSKLVRAQGCWVTDIELDRLVRYWKGISIERPLPADAALVQQPLWVGAEAPTSEDESSSEEDDLLEEATKLVCDEQRASISLLQRKLRIGYSRAARLIDLMEERGIIGPSTGGSRPRDVLINTDDLS